MGKKNKNKGGNDDDDFKEGDFTTGFVSHKANIAKELAEATRANESGSDDGAANKKQNKKRKGGNKQLDDEFDAPVKTTVAGHDSDREIDLQKEIAENFEGVSKKNTRKKKNNMGNVYGGQDALAGAFDEGADSDEVHAKKGGKNNNKKERQQGKKKKKQQSESEDEEEAKTEDPTEAETKAQESDKSEEKEYPINMIYCGQCKLPPEYCEFGQKDASACKQWLAERYPQMYQQIYGVAATKVEKEEEKKGDDEADEEAEGEGEAKPKKKVKFGKEVGVITVYKQKRGGRKTISQIVGFEHYTKDMKGLASKFGKKFSCGCNLATDDIHGDCISVQGDVEDRLLEILEQDKELAEFKIDPKKIKFIDDGNKKGRKRPPPKAKEE